MREKKRLTFNMKRTHTNTDALTEGQSERGQ